MVGLFAGEDLLALLDRLYPRLMAQVDRDPRSPTCGCCDRGFWLYRLHDFPSGVLQQAGLTFACLHRLVERHDLSGCRYLSRDLAPHLRQVAEGIHRYTVEALGARGALDEYYPGESSFVGTVFACFSTVKGAMMLGQADVLAHPNLRAAASALLDRAPSPAANQDMGAAAFLALYSKATGFAPEATARTVRGLLAGVDGRGTYAEYGGLDAGYASVTLNFLAHLTEAGTPGAGEALDRTARLLARFVHPGGGMGGEFASRSTTYFLPFGFLCAARRDPAVARAASALDVGACFDKLDDRYLMHYCLPSLAASVLSLAEEGAPAKGEAPAPGAEDGQGLLRDVGIFVARARGAAVFVGLGKGGTLQVDRPDGSDIDTGYRVERGGRVYSTAVLDDAPSFEVEETPGGAVLRVTARFQRYRLITASPSKTVALRLVRFLGPSFNTYFKKRMIVDTDVLPGVRLLRRIEIDRAAGEVRVRDEITGLAPGDVAAHAPPLSPRLVPSARFHQRDEERAYLPAQSGRLSLDRTYRLEGSADRREAESFLSGGLGGSPPIVDAARPGTPAP